MHKIEIMATNSIFPSVVVNGTDVSGLVLDYSISQKAGEIPIVTLHLDGTDMAVSERGKFRFARPVREFLEKLQKSSAASDDAEAADNQITSADGPQDSY